MKKIQVIVLAAGVGKRMWPIRMTKSFIPFIGKPLIIHTIENLQHAGFTNILVIGNSRDFPAIKAISMPGITFSYAIQEEAKGMADALMHIHEEIRHTPCLIVNAEDVVQQNLYQQIGKEVVNNTPFIVGKKVSKYFPGGYIQYQGKQITKIIEKPEAGCEPSNVINLVFHFFPDISQFIQIIKKTRSKQDDVYEQALSTYILEMTTKVLLYEGVWYPMKFPWHILDSMEYFLEHKLSEHRGINVKQKKNVVIEGPVYIDDNVTIYENSKIIGPCYIGRNTIIGNNTIIRRSHIEHDCVTGFNTDITRSYIGPHCWFHTNYAGDSVCEENVSMGSGAVLANLRLDEGEIQSAVGSKRITTQRRKLGAIIGRDVRIGVNTSIMPGVKIGQNSFVGAGIVIEQDVQDDSFCYAESNLIVKRNTSVLPASRHDFRTIL